MKFSALSPSDNLLSLYFQSDQTAGNLNEELRNILPQLEEMRKRKSDRKEQFVQVLEQIQMTKNEIYGSTIHISSKTVVDETDLSLRKLEEFHRELHELQKEKVWISYFSFIYVQLSLDFKYYLHLLTFDIVCAVCRVTG